MTRRQKHREPLTARQRETLTKVVKFIDRNGYPPTVRELAEMLDVKVSAAHRLLGRLRDAGWVDWEDGQRRTLTVL